MDVFGVCGLAVCSVFFLVLLRKGSGELALLLALAVSLLLLRRVMDRMEPLLAQIEGITGGAAAYQEPLRALLKAVGIAVTGQLAVSLCRDAGESAVAYGVSLTVKAAILAAALPLLQEVFSTLEEILRLSSLP